MTARARTVTADTRVDFDLRWVSLSSTVTLAGAPFGDRPGLTSRGTLQLTPREAGIAPTTVYVPSTGVASFAVPLQPGADDVSRSGVCDGNNGCVLRLCP